MLAFIDPHRERYGVEPIGPVLPIAPSTDYTPQARALDPARVPRRTHRDAPLKREIRRVWEENFQVYGVRKVWRQLPREGLDAARCSVARLMQERGLRGVVRGRPVKPSRTNEEGARPLDRVPRQFKANRPNALWVSDLTYVATGQGFRYGAFVIDAYARRIVGWRVSSSRCTDLALDALEQALYARRRGRAQNLGHYSDRGVQYLSSRDTERLAEAGIEPSVGRVGDSDDNALAESVMGLYKAELIGPRGPWRTVGAVEWATLAWVEWFNHRRLLEPIGHRPPAEAEAQYDEQTSALAA